MDSNKIDALLNKYWNCETSLEEEQALKAYFRSGSIAEHHKDAAGLFGYFETQKKKSLNDIAFDANIMSRTQAPKKGRVMRLAYNTMRIAAGVAVLAVAVFFIRKEVRNTTPQEMVDTYDDPKLALEETKKALMMISRSFGRAEEETKKINLINEAKEDIQQEDVKEESKL